ncbi:MAG: phosphoribosylglycinamide formyltransferase [Novosphingobium sp.]
MKTPVAVLISGTGSNMAALLYAARLPDCAYEIVLVASNNPAAPGLALAAAEGVATFALAHKGMAKAEHEAAMDAAIRGSGAEYVALAGYMRVLSSDFVAAWQGRMLNIHPSLLPAYKGLDTHARALAAGDTRAGCSVHVVTPELDDGPVLGRIEVAVLPDDTAPTLAARVLIAEHQLYPAILASYVSRERDPQWLLGRVRELALALPAAYEKVSHGSPGFFVDGGKAFAYVNLNHHGDGRTALLVKISGADEQSQLVENDPQTYYRPPYFGDGWIGIRLDLGCPDWDGIDGRLKRSWRSSAPRKLTALLDAADTF